MSQVEIVKSSSVPWHTAKSRGKWADMLASIGADETLVLSYETSDDAKRAQTAFRQWNEKHKFGAKTMLFNNKTKLAITRG